MKKGKRILSLLLVMVLLLLSAGNIIAAEVDTAAAETVPPSETDTAPSLEQDSTTEADPYRVYFRDLPGYTMPQPMAVAESVLSSDTEELVLSIVNDSQFQMSYVCDSSAAGLWYQTASRHANELFPQIAELNRREDAALVMIRMLNDARASEFENFELEAGVILSMLQSGVFAEQLMDMELSEQSEITDERAESIATKEDETISILSNDLPIVSSPFDVGIDYVGYFMTLDECRVDYGVPNARCTNAFYQSYDAELCNEFPDNILVSGGTHNYNCHSYAWYMQSDTNDRWITLPTGYINDAHCDRIDADELQVGDRVIYYSLEGMPCHSAVVYEVNATGIRFISKMGFGGVFIHELEDVTPDCLDYGYGYCYYYRYPDDHTWDHEVTSENGHHCRCYTCGRTTVQPHTFTVSQHNAAVHIYGCDECGYEYTEAHNMTTSGVCRKCGYSGFVIDPVTAMPSDDEEEMDS